MAAAAPPCVSSSRVSLLAASAGGRTEIEGIKSVDFQRNSRVDATLSLPLGARQPLKFSASTGALTTIGADFDAFAVGCQVLCGGGL